MSLSILPGTLDSRVRLSEVKGFVPWASHLPDSDSFLIYCSSDILILKHIIPYRNSDMAIEFSSDRNRRNARNALSAAFLLL